MQTPVTIRMMLEKTVLVCHHTYVNPVVVVDGLFQKGEITLSLEDDLMLEETSVEEDRTVSPITTQTVKVTTNVEVSDQ